MLVFLGLGISVNVMAQNTDGPYVHCLLLDKTKSMIGANGAKNIWNDVQSYCVDWVDGVPKESIVLLFTFDKDIEGPKVFHINSESDRQQVKAAIKKIQVDGKFTWIASNLDKVVKYVYSNFPNYIKQIYLITDGKEEQPGSDFKSVLNNYSNERGDYDYLYYVDINDGADETTRKHIDETEGAGIGKGFAKAISARPEFKELNFVLGQTKTLEQRFIVKDQDYIPDLLFNLQVVDVKSVDNGKKIPNISLTPSIEIKLEKLIKVDNGKYKLNLDLSFLNNSECECDVVVKLEGVRVDDNILTFAPSSFRIIVRKMPPPPPAPKPIVKSQGWK